MTSVPRIFSIIPYQVYPAKLGGEKGIAIFNQYLNEQAELAAVTIKANDPALAPYKLHNIITNGRIRYANLFLFFTVRKLLREHKATHLLIEHPYFGWLAWLIKKSTRIIWVVHSHNMEYMRSKSIGRRWWRALRAYEKWVYRSADKVFFISDDDRQHAIDLLNVHAEKSITVTYGVEQDGPPNDVAESRKWVQDRHHISPDKHILLFNGALYHSTNYEALQIILDHINPVLERENSFRYVILVCGKGLPAFFNDLKDYQHRNVIYAGFVPEINHYFKAADVFLNPIQKGGGVKTKAIEAIAMNCMVVSTPLGASGIKREVCGSMLQVVEEGDWNEFAMQVKQSANRNSEVPESFFEYYSWSNIIRRVVNNLKDDLA
jgi:polysaccharide biosynthesis protein PslH